MRPRGTGEVIGWSQTINASSAQAPSRGSRCVAKGSQPSEPTEALNAALLNFHGSPAPPIDCTAVGADCVQSGFCPLAILTGAGTA